MMITNVNNSNIKSNYRVKITIRINDNEENGTLKLTITTNMTSVAFTDVGGLIMERFPEQSQEVIAVGNRI